LEIMWQPKMRSSLADGRFPVYVRYGVAPVAEWGRRFLRYTACSRAKDQYSGPSAAEWSKHRTMVLRVRLGLSDSPFCEGAPAAVGSRRYPAFSTTSLKAWQFHSSPPSSVRIVHVVLGR
jgi:hypothetical protein